ncbi:MAG TPA: hypothetical protein EYF98_11475 [Planctomycetes bacterium]|nr:hypothetical protein [Planctomycetota bacterium]
MTTYIDLKTLKQPGEERTALVDIVSESLNEATAQDISTVKVVMLSFRVFPDGREDHGKQAAPLSGINAETADAEQVVNQMLNRFERAVGQGFKGRMLVAVEDPGQRGTPLAGVWERYVAGEGTDSPDAYGTYGDAYGSRQQEQSGGSNYGGGGGSSSHGPMLPGSGGHGPPRLPPPGGGWDVPHPPEPPRLGGSMLGGSLMGGGYESRYDPGSMPDQSAQENADLFRNILGSAERRIDQAHQETRFFQGQSTTMLEYMLRQNAQFMGVINVVLQSGLQQGGGGGGAVGPRFHPLGELAGSLLTAFLGAPEQVDNGVVAQAPSPPRFQALPPAQPAFFHPSGQSADIGGDSFYANGYSPEPEESFNDGDPSGFSSPPTEDEFRAAMKQNPDGAMAAAADLVPAPFKGFLKKGGGSST